MKPDSMTIEVTTQCSLKCVGCARTMGKAAGTWTDRDMSAELFARICANLPPLQRLTLHGIGEPTLNPEYPAIVAMAAKSGKFDVIGANTHALSRNAAYYAQLVETGLNEIYVSVDSLTQEVADRTRAGTKTILLRRRLTEFAERQLPVRITLVASRFNRADIPQTLDALNEIGPFTVYIQKYVDLGRPDGCLSLDDRLAVAALIRERAQWPNLQVHGTLSLGDAWSAPDLCSDPWQGLGVTVDGFLTPCCMMWDPATLGYLSLAEMTMDEAFASPQYRAFLDRYHAEAPEFCAGCQKNTRPTSSRLIPLLRHPAERTLPLAG